MVFNFKQIPDLIRPLDFGSIFPWIGMSPASQSFREQKDAAGSIPNIFAVLSGAGSPLHGNRLSRLAKKLVGLLVHTDNRKIRIVGLLLNFQYILMQATVGADGKLPERGLSVYDKQYSAAIVPVHAHTQYRYAPCTKHPSASTRRMDVAPEFSWNAPGRFTFLVLQFMGPRPMAPLRPKLK